MCLALSIELILEQSSLTRAWQWIIKMYTSNTLSTLQGWTVKEISTFLLFDFCFFSPLKCVTEIKSVGGHLTFFLYKY